MVSILSACTCGIRPSKAAECATSLPYGRLPVGFIYRAVPPTLPRTRLTRPRPAGKRYRVWLIRLTAVGSFDMWDHPSCTIGMVLNSCGLAAK